MQHEYPPYQVAWQRIERNPCTSSASSLVKLILSLWNQSNAFSLRECVDNLDGERTQLALRVAIHFANYREDRELVRSDGRVDAPTSRRAALRSRRKCGLAGF